MLMPDTIPVLPGLIVGAMLTIAAVALWQEKDDD